MQLPQRRKTLWVSSLVATKDVEQDPEDALFRARVLTPLLERPPVLAHGPRDRPDDLSLGEDLRPECLEREVLEEAEPDGVFRVVDLLDRALVYGLDRRRRVREHGGVPDGRRTDTGLRQALRGREDVVCKPADHRALEGRETEEEEGREQATGFASGEPRSVEASC